MSANKILMVSSLCGLLFSWYMVGVGNHYGGNIFGAIMMLYLGTLGNVVIFLFAAINSFFKKTYARKFHPMLYFAIPAGWTAAVFIYLELSPAAGC